MNFKNCFFYNWDNEKIKNTYVKWNNIQKVLKDKSNMVLYDNFNNLQYIYIIKKIDFINYYKIYDYDNIILSAIIIKNKLHFKNDEALGFHNLNFITC